MESNHNPSELLTAIEAARYLHLSIKTLESWRQKKHGPTYVKNGRRIFYRLADLDHHLEASVVSNPLVHLDVRLTEIEREGLRRAAINNHVGESVIAASCIRLVLMDHEYLACKQDGSLELGHRSVITELTK